MRVQDGLDFKNLPVALDSGQRGSGCLVGRIVPEDVIVRVNGGCDATDLFRGPGRRLDCARPSYDDAGARFTRRQKVRDIGAACKPDAVYDRRMKPRIYVDTSVIGGCEDDEFAEHSARLMERFVEGDFVLVLSTLTVQELTTAPGQVSAHLARVPVAGIQTLQLDAGAMVLAGAYIAAGVIAPHMRADGYNSINLRRGYPTLEIRSPREVLSDD